MITTRNRCEDLRRTLEMLRQLQPAASEIWVCADGCEDNTVMMVSAEHPHVNLLVNEVGTGSIPSRDRMLRSALGDWVLSLDDDSYPLDTDFFTRARQLIVVHPGVSVFTFPEQRDNNIYPSCTKTPNSSGHFVPAYPNCAALMDRADYLKVGGYPTFFNHAYEEPDYALQLVEHGKAVWFEPSLIIRHHYSAKNRSQFHTHQLNARNEIWSVWIRCPWPWLPLVMVFRVVRQFRYACSQGIWWAVREPLWWFAAMRGLHHCLAHRRPVLWSRYFAWMKLARQHAGPSLVI